MSNLHVTQTTSAEMRYTRREVLDKLGVDLADSFYVTKEGYGIDAELVISISPRKVGKYSDE
jgi:hypothetical protein